MLCVEKKKKCNFINYLFLDSLDESQKIRNELERSIIKFNKKIKK